MGKCGRAYDPCLLETKPLLDKGNPVCGSDGKTYVSVEALWCVKHKMKKGKQNLIIFLKYKYFYKYAQIYASFSDLKYLHDGRCI